MPARPGSGGQSAGEPDPLDNIPPLDLPGDVPRSSATPPVPPAAEPAAEPGGKSAANKPDAKSETPAAAASELELTSITLPAPEPATSASVGPGLARFVAVDLKLAGGSLPSPAGLDWLVEKGYRTLLDLRESSEVSPSFIAEVTKRGLRYVALPIGPGSIDREHVDRFAFEVAAGEARPLYFFDSDGTRSGALWYIRRIATDRVDQQVARREAEELGLSDQEYWSAVTKYVSHCHGSNGSTRDRSRTADPASPHRPRRHREPTTPPKTAWRRRSSEPARLALPAPTWQASTSHPPRAARQPTEASRLSSGLPGNPLPGVIRRDGRHRREPAAGLLEPQPDSGHRAGFGPVCRHRRNDRDRFPASRVRERDLPGVKRDPQASVESVQPHA